jgi:hypothetical protein
MRRCASGFVLVAVLLGGFLPGTPAWAQSSPTDRASPASTPATTDEKKADELFLKGKALFADGKLEKAYQTYKAAFGVKKRYDIAGNLGNVAFELGKIRDAAEYLTYCVMNFPPAGPADVRAKLEKLLNETRKRVGTLSMTVADKNCQVYLDGKLLFVEQAPAQPVDIFVDPGPHTIEVKRAGFKPTRRTVQAQAGSREELAVEIPSAPENASPTRTEFPKHDSGGTGDRSGDTQSNRYTWKPWAIGGGAALAAAGIGVGIGFTFMSNAKGSDALKLAGELVDATPSSQTICGTPHPATNQVKCDHITDLIGTRDTFATVAVVGYAVGGAAAIGTVLLAVLRRKPDARPSRVHVTPVLSPAQGGVVLTGSF